MSSVVSDESVEVVKQLLLDEVITSLAIVLLRTYATVIHRRVSRTLSP